MNVELKRVGLAVIVLVLAACGSAPPATPLTTPTTSPEEMATAFYETLQAPSATLPATPIPPTAAGPTETLAAEPTTGTQAPAGTVQPGATLRATTTPTRLATLKGPVKPPVGGDGCMLQAEFVEDINVPDDTIFKPNEGFKKTWELKNIGTFTPAQTERVSAVLTKQLSAALGVAPNRIYIEFVDAKPHLWGHDGGTFA